MEKAPDAFRTISEVAEELEIPQHVLRFWESRFREVKPMKRGGGRRYYRPEDIGLLRGIRHLLYGEGYTIRGVQRILREQGVKFVQTVWQPGAPQPSYKPETEPDDGSDVAVAEEGEASISSPSARVDDAAAPREPPPLVPQPPLAAPQAAVPAPATPQAGVRLSREDISRLQAALDELHECRRLLDLALEQPA